MRSLSFLTIATLTGCASPLVGQWEGVCTTRVGTDLVDYDIELDFSKVAKGDVDGSAEVVDLNDKQWEGDVDGTLEGKDLDVEIDLPEAKFALDGKLKGDTISGDCEWQGTKGDFELDKVE